MKYESSVFRWVCSTTRSTVLCPSLLFLCVCFPLHEGFEAARISVSRRCASRNFSSALSISSPLSSNCPALSPLSLALWTPFCVCACMLCTSWSSSLRCVMLIKFVKYIDWPGGPLVTGPSEKVPAVLGDVRLEVALLQRGHLRPAGRCRVHRRTARPLY